MQQTEKYQFNLIEGGDDFSPGPLNENTEKVEAQLQTMADTLAAHAANLGTGGSNARIAWGSYAGNNNYGASHPTALSFDFRPVLVYVLGISNGDGNLYQSFFLRPTVRASGPNGPLLTTWSSRGLSWYYDDTIYGGDVCIGQLNKLSYTYYYVAIGVDG